MKSFSKKVVYAFIIGALLALAVPMTASAADAEQSGCVIPESGPWPPCATGGSSAPAPAGNACPTTGVWPPGCVPGGSSDSGNSAPAPAPAGNACPTTGVWPPGCVPGGSSDSGNSAPAPAPAGNACPTTGVWPPGCVPGGSSSDAPAPAPAPDTTPAPAPEPAPAPAPEPDTSSDSSAATEGEILGFITIYYPDNPDEVLAVIPAMAFDANLMLQRMEFMQAAMNGMVGALNSINGGDNSACAEYIRLWDALNESGIWFVDVPAEWAELDERYYISWEATLDRTRPSYLSCQDAGRIDSFNSSLAAQILDAARSFNDASINATKERLGQ